MLKIAVASENDQVSGHFGHCLNINIYETENGRIIAAERLENNGAGCGMLPELLSRSGVKVVIAGGMGENPNRIFAAKGIEVITGASGAAVAAVEAYLQGKLKSTGALCQEHHHHGECGGH